GSGAGPHVKVFEGDDGSLLASFFAFAPNFTGGISVGAGDVNGDGRADVIVGAGPGAGPHVKVIDGTKLGQVLADGQIADGALLASYFAFAPDFTGGVRVAADDENADNRADVIVGAGPGAGPHVKVIDGTKLGQVLADGQIADSALLASFLASDPNFTGGVFVAADADHRDGPILVNTATQGTHDINDIYVFRSPANANNTVFFLSFQPFPGNLTPRSVDPTQQYDIKIDTTGDAVEDTTFRLTFGPADSNGVQDVTLRGLPAAAFPGTGGILARGRTGTNAPTGVNIPVAGGGTFRAGIHDDPFFFDEGAFSTLESTGAG